MSGAATFGKRQRCFFFLWYCLCLEKICTSPASISPSYFSAVHSLRCSANGFALSLNAIFLPLPHGSEQVGCFADASLFSLRNKHGAISPWGVSVSAGNVFGNVEHGNKLHFRIHLSDEMWKSRHYSRWNVFTPPSYFLLYPHLKQNGIDWLV